MAKRKKLNVLEEIKEVKEREEKEYKKTWGAKEKILSQAKNTDIPNSDKIKDFMPQSRFKTVESNNNDFQNDLNSITGITFAQKATKTQEKKAYRQRLNFNERYSEFINDYNSTIN